MHGGHKVTEKQRKFREFENRGWQLTVLRHAPVDTPMQMHLLRTLDDRIGDGHCWILTIQQIADDMRCSYSTANRVVNELVEAQYIWRDRISDNRSDGRYEVGICWANLADEPEPVEEPKPVQKRKPTAKKQPRTFDPKSIEFPSEINTPQFRESWESWCDDCDERGIPIGKTAATKQIEACARAGPHEAVAAINRSINGRWKGLFPREPSEQRQLFGHSVARVHAPRGKYEPKEVIEI